MNRISCMMKQKVYFVSEMYWSKSVKWQKLAKEINYKNL